MITSNVQTGTTLRPNTPAPTAKPAAPKRMGLAQLAAPKPGEVPIRAFIYGVPKVGKSSFAAGAPNPVFISGDHGLDHLGVTAWFPETWSDVLEALDTLATESHDFKTVAIDPLTFIEQLLFTHVCAKNRWATIEEPSYGRGYKDAIPEWRRFIDACEVLYTKRRMNVIFVAHAKVGNRKNPAGDDWQRFAPAMHDTAAGLIQGWVDLIGFAEIEQVATVRDGKKKGFSTGNRILHTTNSAVWDAGNRYGLPTEIPLGWRPFIDAKAGSATVAALVDQILALAASHGPDAIEGARAQIEEAAGDEAALRSILAVNTTPEEASK